MVTVTARQSFPYAGITRRVGESFLASDRDARLLELVGKVDVPSCDVEVDPEESTVAWVGGEDKPRPRRSYRRKDIIAE